MAVAKPWILRLSLVRISQGGLRYGTRKAERLAEAGNPVEGARRHYRVRPAAPQPGRQQDLGSHQEEQSPGPEEQARDRRRRQAARRFRQGPRLDVRDE